MARHKQASVDEMKKPLPVLARLQHYAFDFRATKPVSFDTSNVSPVAMVSSQMKDGFYSVFSISCRFLGLAKHRKHVL